MMNWIVGKDIFRSELTAIGSRLRRPSIQYSKTHHMQFENSETVPCYRERIAGRKLGIYIDLSSGLCTSWRNVWSLYIPASYTTGAILKNKKMIRFSKDIAKTMGCFS